ncbi:hypothetical protein ACIHCM_29820 [Streptomyces sp. NPDC052023]|uniref:hypothetical protein n=1 Tax=Streptomyces sp. NPDC052023 TaxID=3365681 RepID=UPI0037D1A007
MQGNAENDEGSVEERDRYDGELEGEGTDEYAGSGPYDEEPGAYEAEDAASARRAGVAPRGAGADADPDVFLDVPALKVDEIDLDVEDLRARVSLQAEVLDLLKLNVGADVTLGRVHLGISGVEAQAQLRVRLDNVATIINRVLTTLDRNPEILHELARGVGSAVRDVGGGARQAVGELGSGAGRAVEDVGQGAGRAVQDVGRGAGQAVQDVGQGAGGAVQDVGRGAGAAAKDVGQGAGGAVQGVGRGAGRAVEDIGGEAGQAVGEVAQEVGDTAEAVAEKAPDITEAAGRTVGEGGEELPGSPDAPPRTARRTASAERSGSRRTAAGSRGRTARTETGTRARRVRDEEGKLPPRPSRRRTTEEREEPP